MSIAGSPLPACAAAAIYDLPAGGMGGNSHMLMTDRNSDQILDVIVRRLDRQHAAGAFDQPQPMPGVPQPPRLA